MLYAVYCISFLDKFCSCFSFSVPLCSALKDIDDSFYLVLMMVFITPTANNVMVSIKISCFKASCFIANIHLISIVLFQIMVELGENVSKEGISRLIGWQYLFAPGK